MTDVDASLAPAPPKPRVLTVDDLENELVYTAPDGSVVDVPGFERGEARVAQRLSARGEIFNRRVVIWDRNGVPSEVSSLAVHRYLAKRDVDGAPVFFRHRPNVPAPVLSFTCDYPNGRGGICGKKLVDAAMGELHARRYHREEHRTRKEAKEKEEIASLKMMVQMQQSQIAALIASQQHVQPSPVVVVEAQPRSAPEPPRGRPGRPKGKHS